MIEQELVPCRNPKVQRDRTCRQKAKITKVHVQMLGRRGAGLYFVSTTAQPSEEVSTHAKAMDMFFLSVWEAAIFAKPLRHSRSPVHAPNFTCKPTLPSARITFCTSRSAAQICCKGLYGTDRACLEQEASHAQQHSCDED